MSAASTAADPRAPGRRLGAADVRDPVRLRGRDRLADGAPDPLGLQPPGLRHGQRAAATSCAISDRRRCAIVTAAARDFAGRPRRRDQVLTLGGQLVAQEPRGAPSLGAVPHARRRRPSTATGSSARRRSCGSSATGAPIGRVIIQYGRPRRRRPRRRSSASSCSCSLGVLAGTVLALLAGMAIARRAMAPIAELTSSRRARSRARATRRRTCPSRWPTTRSPSSRARWRACSASSTPRATRPSRCSRASAAFVADASHELRTPLTSVLANLELLAESLQRRPGRGGPLGAALLPADAPAGRRPAAARAHRRRARGRRASRCDLAQVVVEAAGELGPVSGEHEIALDVAPGDAARRARDELHRLDDQPDRERAAPHPARHRDHASRTRDAARRSGRAGRRRRRPRRAARAARPPCSSASCAAPATAAAPSAWAWRSCRPSPESHGGTGHARADRPATPGAPRSGAALRRAACPAAQTSTTTGSTIGRRFSRS